MQSQETAVAIPIFPPTLSEKEHQIQADYQWCLNDPAVRLAHGGKVVAAHQKKIWGVGANHLEALKSAQKQPTCPSKDQLVLVVVPEPLPSN